MNNLINLADQLGELDVQIKKLEAQAKVIKATLDAEGIDTVVGNTFMVTRTQSIRCALNVPVVKEEMGDAWVTLHSKFTPVTTFRVTVRKEALVAL